MAKTPDYITTEDFRFTRDWHNELTIPKGCFVRPIETYYLPKHIKDDSWYKWFDPDKEIHVYCSFGIVCIPKKIVRRVG